MNIWRKDSDKPAKLKKKHIELVEKTFGVTLPKSYIKTLKKQNGGYLKTDAVQVNFVVEDEEKYILLDSLYGIDAEEGIIETEYYRKEWEITKDNIIIIGGDGHAFVAFDYEGTTTSPKIIYIDTDSDEVRTICDSFDTLLDLMYELEDDDDSYDIHIPTHEEIRTLATSADISEVAEGAYLWINDYSMPKEDELLYAVIKKVFEEGTADQKINVSGNARNEIIIGSITNPAFIELCLTLLRKETDLDLVINKEMIEEFLAEQIKNGE